MQQGRFYYIQIDEVQQGLSLVKKNFGPLDIINTGKSDSLIQFDKHLECRIRPFKFWGHSRSMKDLILIKARTFIQFYDEQGFVQQ